MVKVTERAASCKVDDTANIARIDARKNEKRKMEGVSSGLS